jgi:hypothetical protein
MGFGALDRQDFLRDWDGRKKQNLGRLPRAVAIEFDFSGKRSY